MLKRVSSEELGKYISKQASEYFNKYYSDDFGDYIEDICVDYMEKYDLERNSYLYHCHIELTSPKTGKPPLIINFYQEDLVDNNEEIIDINYYL